MSEFIEFVFPCTDCLVTAACKDRKRVSNKDLLDRTNVIRCLALPEYDRKISSHTKMLLECLSQMSWRVGQKLNDEKGDSPLTTKKIPVAYRHFLIEYLSIFEWITNSTSWRENFNEIADFDKFEIRQKLKTVGSMLDWKE